MQNVNIVNKEYVLLQNRVLKTVGFTFNCCRPHPVHINDRQGPPIRVQTELWGSIYVGCYQDILQVNKLSHSHVLYRHVTFQFQLDG